MTLPEKFSYISSPGYMIQLIPATSMNAFQAMEKRSGSKNVSKPCSRGTTSSGWMVLLILFVCVSMLKFIVTWHSVDLFKDSCFPIVPARRQETYSAVITEFLKPLSSLPSNANLTDSEKLFFKQPDGLGYKPCVKFSNKFGKDSLRIAERKRRYLVVVVSGGLNQQRNQIVDAVVIARILEAALVIPIMQVNQIWEDDSEFSDIFDADHFKRVLKGDVLVVSNLPSTHIMNKPVEERKTPLNASPEWFRTHYSRRFDKEGVLLLRGLDSRLAKDLPADLQKLRCKVAFQALRFAAPIQALGEKLARRMSEKGPYLALHLRLEKDVWIRTGCSTGLGPAIDEAVKMERMLKPSFLTARSNMTYEDRRLAGFCPLNAAEIVRLLKALGAREGTRIFWAGGEPLGGVRALRPLFEEFPLLYNKETIANEDELQPFLSRASMLAAIDYLVCLNSDVFMPSHGGNMGRAIQGARAYGGMRKHITPNKRLMIPLFNNATLSQRELEQQIAEIHSSPSIRADKRGSDVLAFPIPDCMCTQESPTHSVA